MLFAPASFLRLRRALVALTAALSTALSPAAHAEDTPFIGEIRLFAGNFAPLGWAFADGRLLSIAEHDALFVLIGTTFGGDGQTNFALPDLRGRIPVHTGTLQSSGEIIVWGQKLGAPSVTLTTANLPGGTSLGDSATLQTLQVSNAIPASSPRIQASAIASQAQISPGGAEPVTLLPPTTGLNFIISLYGVFPSQ
ncbi:MAG: tail fiber protein [Rhodocyclaceae bacterium]